MRILLAVMLLAAAGWSGSWFAGAWLAEHSLAGWLEDRPAAGLVTGHEGIAVRGFPLRFEISIENPQLRDLGSGTAWSAPRITLGAPGYRLTRLAAELPEGARFDHPEGGLSLSTGAPAPRATLNLSGLRSLVFEDAAVSGDALVFATQDGAQTRLDRLRLSLRRADGGEAHYHLSLAAEELAPDADWLAAEPFRSPPPDVIEVIGLEAALELDAPLDRAGFATYPPPRLTSLTLSETRIQWGSTLLEASGALVIGADGRPEGVIDFSARDWQRLLDAAVALEFVNPEIAQTWERALDFLEEEGETAGQLDVALRFTEGRMRLGPLPLGPAPRVTGR